MARYVAGIDGGQSSTTAVIVRDDGALLARGTAGPAAHVDEPPGSRRCADACATALARAVEIARLAQPIELEAAHIGLSGWDAQFDGAQPALPARTVRIGHDAPIALAGAVRTRPAIVVIAGTGSVAYGEDAAGGSLRIGGWGSLFGDAGSAYALARDALNRAMSADDRGVRSALGDVGLAFFDRRDLREIATAAVQGKITRAELASFARVVHDAARLGDPDAAELVDESASALAALAATALERLGADGPTKVAFAGGAFANEAFFARVRDRLALTAPRALAVRPRYEPAVGAALLAFAEAGIDAPESITEG